MMEKPLYPQPLTFDQIVLGKQYAIIPSSIIHGGIIVRREFEKAVFKAKVEFLSRHCKRPMLFSDEPEFSDEETSKYVLVTRTGKEYDMYDLLVFEMDGFEE